MNKRGIQKKQNRKTILLLKIRVLVLLLSWMGMDSDAFNLKGAFRIGLFDKLQVRHARAQNAQNTHNRELPCIGSATYIL